MKWLVMKSFFKCKLFEIDFKNINIQSLVLYTFVISLFHDMYLLVVYYYYYFHLIS